MSAAVDFGRAAADYGRHRQGFPGSFFARLRERGVGVPGQRVLDLGTGTGQMARGLARGGADVTGLDRSAELLAVARVLDREAGVEVAQVRARAEATGLAAGAFDVVTAAQCWHWFEKPRVCDEVARLLTPEGLLVIAHLDWLPRPGNVVAATEALVLRHNPRWNLAGGDGLHPGHVGDVDRAGFGGIETFSYDAELVYSHEGWRGRIRACAGVGASLSAQEVARFDAELGELLAERFPADPLSVPHRVFAVLARRPVEDEVRFTGGAARRA